MKLDSIHKRAIAIEGLDGTGKESVSKALRDLMIERGFTVERVSFPRYDTNIGRVIQDYLSGEFGDPTRLSGNLISPLYTLDRIQYLEEHHLSESENDFLIMDRSYFSNFIYQASKLKNPMELTLWMLRSYFHEIAATDLERNFFEVYYLRLPECERQKQIASRANLDGHESNTDYLQRCEKFVEFSRSSIFEKSLQQNLTLAGEVKYLNELLHFFKIRVRIIDVRHENDPEKIDEAIRETAEKIYAFATRNLEYVPADLSGLYKKEYPTLPNYSMILHQIHFLKSDVGLMKDMNLAINGLWGADTKEDDSNG